MTDCQLMSQHATFLGLKLEVKELITKYTSIHKFIKMNLLFTFKISQLGNGRTIIDEKDNIFSLKNEKISK